MSDSPFPMPAPEHEIVMKSVGTWNVDAQFFMAPDAPPVEAKGTEVIEATGPFWVTSKLEMEMPPMEPGAPAMPYTGRSTLGYEPSKGKFVGTWIDSFNPYMSHMAGDYHADKKMLACTGEGYMPAFQQVCPFRVTNTENDDGTVTFEMFVTVPGGPEVKMFIFQYTRA